MAQAADYGTNASSNLGIPGINIDPFSTGLVGINLNGGYSGPLVGYSASLPCVRAEASINIVNTWTETAGAKTSFTNNMASFLLDRHAQTHAQPRPALRALSARHAAPEGRLLQIRPLRQHPLHRRCRQCGDEPRHHQPPQLPFTTAWRGLPPE